MVDQTLRVMLAGLLSLVQMKRPHHVCIMLRIRPVQTIKRVLWHSRCGSHKHDVREFEKKMLGTNCYCGWLNRHLNTTVQAERPSKFHSFEQKNFLLVVHRVTRKVVRNRFSRTTIESFDLELSTIVQLNACTNNGTNGIQSHHG